MNSLANLRKGQSSTLENLGMDPILAQRLMAMGIMPGQSLAMEQSTPFGGPVLCRFDTARVGMRRMDAIKLPLVPFAP